MAAGSRIVVHYDDGSTETFNPNRPRFLLDMEKRFGVQTPERHEHIAWLAHHALASDQKFDDWVDTVEEFESVEPEDLPDKGDASGEPDPS